MTVVVALYARFSDEQQVRGISLQAQLSRLYAEAEAAHERIHDVYVDQARSGTKASSREEYQRLLSDARARLFHRIRIESVDRGHRNDTERRAFEAEMGTLGIEVVYCGEPIKQAPDQRKLQRGLRSLMAEYEVDQLSQRVYDRQRHRATKGKWRGGPIPYGVQPDGDGWFIPDPETYDILLWILERRAEGIGYHTITKLLNTGIDGRIPPTPGVIAYLRRPYIERQTLEGDIIQIPKPEPHGKWQTMTVRRICEQAIDGVYSGTLRWGRTVNRFDEDRYGNKKTVLKVDTGRPLVSTDILDRILMVERGRKEREHGDTINLKNTFLLDLECSVCGCKIHGYTSTSISRGKSYRYRRYRCDGRSNKSTGCRMPMVPALKIEQAVLQTIVHYIAQHSPEALRERINQSTERYRAELTTTLDTLTIKRRELELQRDQSLDSMVQSRTPVIAQALEQRIAGIIEEIESILKDERIVRAGISTLDSQARSSLALIEQVLHLEGLEDRIQEPSTQLTLKRALRSIIRRAELQQVANSTFVVAIEARQLVGDVREFVTGGSTNVILLTNEVITKL